MQETVEKRNRHDQQEVMYPCEIAHMAKKSKLRIAELINGLISGSKVFRVDFISEDPPRVFGTSAVIFPKDMTPSEFTDTLRLMADNIDSFLWRKNDINNTIR